MFLPEIVSASLATNFPDALSRKFSLQLIRNLARVPKIGRDMHVNMGLTSVLYTHAVRGYYCNFLLSDETLHRERMETAMGIIISIADSVVVESKQAERASERTHARTHTQFLWLVCFSTEKMKSDCGGVIVVDSASGESMAASMAPSAESGESRIEQHGLASIEQFVDTIVHDICKT